MTSIDKSDPYFDIDTYINRLEKTIQHQNYLIESLKKVDSNLENVDMEKLKNMTKGKFIQGEDQELYLGWLPEAYQVGNNEDENDDEDENIDEGELPAVLEVRDMFLIRIVYL